MTIPLTLETLEKALENPETAKGLLICIAIKWHLSKTWHNDLEGSH